MTNCFRSYAVKQVMVMYNYHKCIILHKDGWGESLEQKYMRTECGEINISFWSDDESWALVPEDEYLSDNTQDMEMRM